MDKELTSKELEEQANALLAGADFEEIKLPKKAKKAAAEKKAEETALAENSVVGESCIDILMIAKYLERIGDHATNIAEWVEYSVTGVHVGESVE